MPSDDTTRTDEPNESDTEDTNDGDASEGASGDGETEPATGKIGADPARDVFSSVEPSPESEGERDDVESDEDDTESGTEGDERPETGEMAFCRECGERLAASAPTCPHCGAPQDSASPSKTEKDPGIAALASLVVPGAGQLYNGQFVRGAIAFVGVGIVDAILVGVAVVLSLILIGPLFLLLIPVVHILVAYDAYDQAKKINSGEVDPGA